MNSAGKLEDRKSKACQITKDLNCLFACFPQSNRAEVIPVTQEHLTASEDNRGIIEL